MKIDERGEAESESVIGESGDQKRQRRLYREWLFGTRKRKQASYLSIIGTFCAETKSFQHKHSREEINCA